MFTSNGLMCLSGVTMCRMFLSAMAFRPAVLLLHCRCFGGFGRHCRSPIERPADTDVQTPRVRMLSRERGDAVRLPFRRRKRESGRAPRTLPDTDRALAFKHIEDRCNVRARKPNA